MEIIGYYRWFWNKRKIIEIGNLFFIDSKGKSEAGVG
jgi:hypothetical protein